MLNLVLDKAALRMRTQLKVVVGSTVLPFQPKKYEEILNFLRMCLIHSAGVALPERDDLNQPQATAPLVSKYLQRLQLSSANSVERFAEFADNLGPILRNSVLAKMFSDKCYRRVTDKVSSKKYRYNFV
jgi:proteasome component ECM29